MKDKEDTDISFINLDSMETIVLSDKAFVEFERLCGIESVDLLTTCGTFCTKECVSSEDLCKLLKENKIDN